jgi:hypothetical protein
MCVSLSTLPFFDQDDCSLGVQLFFTQWLRLLGCCVLVLMLLSAASAVNHYG